MDTTASSIDHDLLCVGCGYNLRMQPRDGRCPECAKPVAESLSGFVLHGADPAWCRSTARGLYILSWATVLLISRPMNSLLFGFIGTTYGVPGIQLSAHITNWLEFPAKFALFVGAWWITQSDSAIPHQDRWLRMIIRIASLALLIVTLWEVAVYINSLRTYGFIFLPGPPAPTWQPNMFQQLIKRAIPWFWLLRTPTFELGLGVLLWRWFKRCGRNNYQRLIYATIILAIVIQICWVIIRMLASQNPGQTYDPWDLTTYTFKNWFVIATHFFHITLLILCLIATRAAAATMLRPPTIPENKNEST